MTFAKPLSFKYQRITVAVIRYAVWLNFFFSPGFRDVAAPLTQRLIDVNHRAVGCGTIKFGPLISPATEATLAGSAPALAS
tara:strand:+ start:893 stop:1135 length:243 start_codon:yes stop_codon:yes gene_type:complete